MNKLYILVFLLPLFANAKGFKGDFKVSLDYKTKLSFTGKHSLERKNKKILLNGIPLSSERILISKNKISYLVMNKNDPKVVLACASGVYTYSVVKAKKKQLERGCVSSKRFGTLVSIFKNL